MERCSLSLLANLTNFVFHPPTLHAESARALLVTVLILQEEFTNCNEQEPRSYSCRDRSAVTPRFALRSSGESGPCPSLDGGICFMK
jgi:hypothetical protein